MRKKINLGFDIGVASVGWSIIDENNNLINYGVRLFNDAASEKDGSLENQKRRAQRSLRRRLRRIKTRKEALLKLFVKYGFVQAMEYDDFCKLINDGILDKDNVPIPTIKIKAKGLKEKLNKNELIVSLFHYIHNRGYFYITEQDLEEKNKKDFENTNLKQHPTLIQVEFYDKNGYYKSMDANAEFSHLQWKAELQDFFKIQKLDENFEKEYMELFSKIRDFSQGPGSEKSPTKYGLYILGKDGNVIKRGENLWEETIGKCSIYKEEFRGGKNSPIAEVFNFLNDINNLYLFNDREQKINSELKNAIFEEFNKGLTAKTAKKSVSLKSLVSVLKKEFKEITTDDIFGYRISSSNKEKKEPEFTKLENTVNIAKWLLTNNLNKELSIWDLKDLQRINSVFESLSKHQDLNKRIDQIVADFKVDKAIAQEIVSNVKSVMKTHSLSYKAMLEYIPFGIKDNVNQMQYFGEKIYNKQNDLFMNGDEPKKYIPKNIFNEEIISPTVRRSFIQTINVMNKIIKLYSKEYEIDNITIELPREKNSAEERKAIDKRNKNNANELSKIFEENNISKDYINKLNSKDRLKIKLLAEQNYMDIYDGQDISIQDIIDNPQSYQEEHIIPYSICYINARYNKVVTKTSNNKEKGNQTPYQWLSAKGKYEEFEQRVKYLYNSKKISKNKFEFLTYMKDPNVDFGSFIEKNLVDTRYASRLILNTFQQFFKNNKNHPSTKIKVINGQVTDYARYNLFINVEDGNKIFFPKKREFYEHHAIDATILAFLGANNKISKLTKYRAESSKFKKKEEFLWMDEETGEVFNVNEFVDVKIIDQDIQKLCKQIKNTQCKFSRPIITKNNIALSNETIYSCRKTNDKNKIVKISKINILNKDESFNEYFDEESSKKEWEKLLCFQHDIQFYNLLKSIWKENRNLNGDKELTKNPFINHMIKNYKNESNKYKHLIIEINGIKKFVKSLRIENETKPTNNVLFLKNHNNKAFLESLNPLSVRIYKNSSNKFVLVPINAKCLKYENNKLVPSENKINHILKEMNIENKNYIEIKKNMPIINSNNELFYFNGGGNFNQSLLELKCMFANNNVYFENKNNQQQISLSTIMKNYKLCELDVLGNIFNIKEWNL